MTEPNVETNEPITDSVDDPASVLPDLEPLAEPESSTEPEPSKVHPLSPGGPRFEQVYARGKQAERDLAAEREKRIAAEAKLEVLTKTKPAVNETAGDEEYSWAQLNEFIAAGRISLADAQAHRESVLEKKLLNKAKAVLEKETVEKDRLSILNKNLFDYVSAFPALNDETSPDFKRVNDEVNWQLDAQGLDINELSPARLKAIQLTAMRTTFGAIDLAKRRNVAPVQETHQGLPGGTPPARKPNPDQDLINKLDERTRAYYRDKIRTGMYKGWEDVVAELKFDPTNIKKK